MPQTFLDIQNLALHDDFDQSKYRTEARQAILDAIGEISRTARIPANEATYSIPVVAGTSDYSLPTTNVRVLSLFDAETANPLADVGREALDDTPASRGRPTGYALYGSNLTLYPTPDRAYTLTLRHLRSGVLPTSDTDVMASVTGIPEDYLHALVEYARFRLFRKEDDFEAANYWEGQYRQTVQRLKADIQRRDTSTVRRVRGMYPMGSGPRFARP